jgi:hypothetical protein
MLELCINSLQGIHNKREQTTKVKKNHPNIFKPHPSELSKQHTDARS